MKMVWRILTILFVFLNCLLCALTGYDYALGTPVPPSAVFNLMFNTVLVGLLSIRDNFN